MKHENNDSHVGQHRFECCITAYITECGIVNACLRVQKNVNWVDLHQEVKTATDIARKVPEAGIDIELFLQLQILEMKLKWFSAIIIQNFVNSKNWRITTDKNEVKIAFSGYENKLPPDHSKTPE